MKTIILLLSLPLLSLYTLTAQELHIKLSAGSSINFNKNTIDENSYATHLNANKQSIGLILGAECFYKFNTKWAVSAGIQYLTSGNYFKLSNLYIPELSASYLEWWYKGYQIGVPIKLIKSFPSSKIGTINLSIGGNIGINSLMSKTLHQRFEVLNPNEYLLGLSSGHEEGFPTYFMGGISAGLEWLPFNKQPFWKNMSIEAIYQQEFNKSSTFSLYAQEENVDLLIIKYYNYNGINKYNRLLLKINYNIPVFLRKNK